MNYKIEPYQLTYKKELIEIWEKSVLATHHFLSSKDFLEIKEMLLDLDFRILHTHCLIKKEKIIGFIAIIHSKIEMLFIHPDYTRKGLGNQLMQFAISNYTVNLVDVNEQNKNAMAFYQKFGFKVFERTEKDDQGKNYPLLRMRL